MYNSPGNADVLTNQMKAAWNSLISDTYASLSGLHSRFFTIDPGAVPSPTEATISWFGDPAEPAFCLDESAARVLSDWGVRGRHALHNEYCEYTVEYAIDAAGNRRPKCVHVTTELREYWVLLAEKDPDTLRSIAAGIVGRPVDWQELYGVTNPGVLTPEQRRIMFAKQCAGHGNDRELAEMGVPVQPVGALNRENALFMTHPINGLDDLLYIVLFGAHPYARRTNQGIVLATKEQIFREANVQHLACRHADPAAATGAHLQAFNGRTLAFANPLCVGINTFASDAFQYQGSAAPASWTRLSRGNQHLRFGPGDDEPIYLDDIRVASGELDRPLEGGFDVARHIEVGPRMLIGTPTQVGDNEYKILTASTQPIRCSEADICDDIKGLYNEWQQSSPLARMAPRRMGRGMMHHA